MARIRITGTVEEAVKIEEALLKRRLPESFRNWLLDNNGKDLAGIRIYPVRDERDTRKTWESLAYLLQNEWAESLQKFDKTDIDYSHLLPFADSGMCDYYCFDYSAEGNDGEWPVVLWLSQTGQAEFYANDFLQFKQRMLAGDSR